MHWNTIRSTFGFIGTMLRKWTGVTMRGNDIGDVYNYRLVAGRIHSSGQPTKAQFHTMRDRGIDRVINLLPHDSENALAGEAELLTSLGMNYVYIPVNFEEPKETDFEQFCAAVDDAGDDEIWVHCAANMRVSAFLYRYRRDILNENEAQARADLEPIWEPFGVWKKFIAPRQ